MKIKVYSHCIDLPGNHEIMCEQTNLLFTSGLIYNSEVFFYCNYNFDNYRYLAEMYKRFPNVHFIDGESMPEEFELSTLAAIKKDCDETDEQFAVLYIHHKGITHVNRPDYQNVRDWRHYMQYFNIERWRDCVEKLEQGFDSVGVEWSGTTFKFPHWRGNIWWATSNYIRTLPVIKRPKEYGFTNQLFLDDHEYLADPSFDYRNDAEFWIGINDPRIWCFNLSYRNHYGERYERNNYAP